MIGRGGKYDYNEKFFEEESTNLAYFLGWFMSDGHMSISNKAIIFSLQARDKYILEMFRDWICPEKPIYNTVWFGKDKEKPFPGNTFCITNKYISELLVEKYNLRQDKTGNEHMLFKENIDMYRNFIRGVFDGDGCCVNLNGRIHFNIVSSSISFLDELVEYFGYGNIYPSSTINGWFVNKNGDVKTFYEFLYSDKYEPYLIRKKEIFDSGNYILHDTDYTEKQLEFMRNNIDKISFDEMANKLGRTKSSIFRKSLTEGFRGKLSTLFTEYELGVIRYMYAEGFNCREIADKLDGRNDKDVERQVDRLGLKKYYKNHQIKKWTKEEDEIIKSNYPVMTCIELMELLPDRTVAAIRCRTEKFGIKRGSSV